MAPPFRIVGGYVDLGSGMVVRPGGVIALSPAEIAVLTALLESRGEPIPVRRLSERLWPAGEGATPVEPLLWRLRRKLAPALGVLERDAGGVRLEPVGGQVDVVHGFAAWVHAGGATLRPPAGVEAITSHLWLADRPGPLVDALMSVPADVPLRAAIDGWSHVREGRAVALHAAESRLRRMLLREARILLADPVIHKLHRPVRAVGAWRRTKLGEPEALWSLEAAGAVAVMPEVPSRATEAGWSEQAEATWGALLAGAGIVLIHGAEGSGRSTLLEALRADAVGRLGRGWHVRQVHLGGVTDASGVLERLVRGLELAPRGSSEEAVVRALRSLQPLLLVVDDLDDVPAEAIDALMDWRRRGARCAVLATSRRPLRLPGALWVHLDALDLDARRRMVHRSTRDLPGWRGLEPDDPVLTSLVELVGGAPLTLRALAGRARFMGPELLLAAIKMERAGRSGGAGRAVLEVALARTAEDVLRGLDRMIALGRPLWFEDVEAVVEDLEVEPLPLLRGLTEAGLLNVVEDPVLFEPHFRVPRAVRELRTEAPSDAVRIQERVDLNLAHRAARLADAIESGREDVRHARQITQLRSAFEAAFERLAGHSEARAQLGRALMVAWELGQLSPAGLLRRMVQVQPPEALAAVHALHLARLSCDVGAHDQTLSALERPAEIDGPIGELARLLRADSMIGHGAHDMRSAVRELMTPSAARLAYLPEMLDVLLVGGNAADVVEIAEQHAALGAERGARWRTAQLALIGFRARAGLGRQRASELRSAHRHLQILKEVRDHRRFAAGLQWVSRALVASGDPAGGLAMLDRSLPMIDAHGPWAVRHVARLDRARALQLVGDLDGARAALDAFEVLDRAGPQLPPAVGGFGHLLLAVGHRDATVLGRAVEAIGEGTTIYHRLCGILAGLHGVFGGEPRVPSTARAPGERMVRELVLAWGDGEGRLAQACGRIERTPEFRSTRLVGVVLRVLVSSAHQVLAAADRPS